MFGSVNSTCTKTKNLIKYLNISFFCSSNNFNVNDFKLLYTISCILTKNKNKCYR